MSDPSYVGTQLRFSVPGPPVAWARASRNGKRYFTAAKQKDQMALMRIAALTAMRDRVLWWERPVEVEVIAFFAPSKSWPKWKHAAVQAGTYHHTKKPDSDNLLKLVKDALSGSVWRDDTYVVDGIGRKRFSYEARTDVVVRPLFQTRATVH